MGEEKVSSLVYTQLLFNESGLKYMMRNLKKYTPIEKKANCECRENENDGFQDRGWLKKESSLKV